MNEVIIEQRRSGPLML